MLKKVFKQCSKVVSQSYHIGGVVSKQKQYRFDDEGRILDEVSKPELIEELKDRLKFSIHEPPEGELYDEILNTVYEPEDIVIIKNLGFIPQSVEELAEKLGMAPDVLDKRIDDIAYRGLIIDLMMGENNDIRYVYLPEYIVGWMETTVNYFLITKEDHVDKLDYRQLMNMYYHYNEMYVAEALNTGDVKTFRAAPYDVEEDVTFVDYETAKGVIETTDDVGLMECMCKGLTKEKGEPYDDNIPKKCCMVLGYPVVEAGVKIGLFERITKEEGLDILKELSDLDHAHCVHNSKRPTSICNCHKDYCQLMINMRRFGFHGLVEKSNFYVDFNQDLCNSCGTCKNKCIIDIIEMERDEETKKKYPVIPKDLCVACGICVKNCETNALKLERRDPPIDYPESYFDTIVQMAFEKNKLNTLLFSDPTKLSHKMMRHVIEYIESNPLTTKLKSIDSVNSVFLKMLKSVTMKQKYVRDYYISRYGKDKVNWKVPDLPKSEHKPITNSFKGLGYNTKKGEYMEKKKIEEEELKKKEQEQEQEQ